MKKLIITMETYVEDKNVERYIKNIDKLIISRLVDIEEMNTNKVSRYGETIKIDIGLL